MPVDPRALRARRQGARHHAGQAARAPRQGMQERKLLRRVAAILFHRRAGFSANGMGVWKVPDEQIMEVGMRMASFRGISHCYQRPTYEDWPYSVFTMAHGRSKEECDAILDLDRRGHRDRGPLDALLVDGVQEDPAPLLHRRVQGLGSRALVSDALRRALRAGSGPAARRRELAGARDAVDRPRPDLHRVRLRCRADRRRRQELHRLRLLVGPADRRPRAPGRGRRGHAAPRRSARASARPPPARSSWRRRSSTASRAPRWSA